MTRDTLAELAGVNRATLSNWGRTTSPTLDTFERAVRALGYRLAIRRRETDR